MKIKEYVSHIPEIKTIFITPQIIEKLNQAINISLEFELMTGKQLNITSMVGEVLVSQELGLKLIVNDTNQSFDAVDKDDKKVQIKARRYKNNETAMTGSLLDKNFKVQFDYAILILLNHDYSIKELFRIDAEIIQEHFDRINYSRNLVNKVNRNNMSISQFRNLSLKFKSLYT